MNRPERQAVQPDDRIPPALREVVPELYRSLKALAASELANERRGHTLSATALVHEAFLRLAAESGVTSDRDQFFGLATRAMRQVLIDHARVRGASKRGRGWQRVLLEESLGTFDGVEPTILDLDGALDRLQRRDARQARVAELRFFLGLSVDETAAVIGVSDRTVKSDWRMARAFLRRSLAAGSDDRA